jgi:GNAT superfamily N-acetyltransferase
MLRMVEVAESERLKLLGMAEEFWTEMLSQSPGAKDPVLGAQYRDPTNRGRYFEGRFPRNAPGLSQWWAKTEESIVGFAGVELAEDHIGNIYGVIRDFYIIPAWRRQNYGRRFAQMLLDWMRRQGPNRVGR